MRPRFPILAVLLALPVAAQWNRYGQEGKGEQISVAEPHSLDYFTGEGRLRDLCEGCKPDRLAKFLAEVHPELSKAGKVGDVFYLLDPAKGFGSGSKSVLVQTGKDQYREISYILNGDQ
jgi:hypothetical protein